MAISSLTARLRALFGEADTSTFDVSTEVNRMFEKSFSINLAPSTNAVINTTKRHIWYAKRNMTVTEVKYVPDASLTCNATNYATVTLYSGNGAAAAATTVAQHKTNAANMAAGVATTITLSSTAANLQVDAGETLAVEILKAGTGGVAVPAGALVIHYIER